MALAGQPRLCCLFALLLLACCTLRTSADLTTSSSTQSRSSATAAAQSKPNSHASGTGGDAADKNHFQKKVELDSFDDLNYDESSASLTSMFGLGPTDLPDSDVDPVLVATGMDSSAGLQGSGLSDYDKDTDSSSDSPVTIAIVNSKRGKKHNREVDAEVSSYGSHHSSSKSNAATSEELMQALDALDDNDKQHPKQHHKQNRLGWVLGRRSVKGRDSRKDVVFRADHHDDSSSSGGGGGGMVGAAFVERRIKPLLAAIKSRAPNLVGRGRNRKYTRAEVEEIVKIMSTELKAKQSQHTHAGSSSSSSDDFGHASSSSDGYVVLSDSPATITSSSDGVTATDDSSSSSSDAYDQDSTEPYDDAYAAQRFKELVQELHHYKKGTPATDAYTGDTTHSLHSHAHVQPHAHAHAHKSHAHDATDTTAGMGATDKHSVGKGTVYEGLLYKELKDTKHQKHKHDSGAFPDAGTDSTTYSDAAKTDKPPAVFHKVVKKTTHGAAHGDAKKAALKARKAAHGTAHANPVTGVVSKDGLAMKLKHKKPHTTVPASAAAKRAAHKASHAKRGQFLDSSEMEDIKTILEAIYDKENNGIAAEVTGEEAAALAEIQAALQPHIITDDPESFALAFSADGSAEDSIPSEQPAAAAVPTVAAPAQQQPAPTPAELPEQPTAAPAAAPTPAPAAQKPPANDKMAPAASSPAPASTNKTPLAAPAAAAPPVAPPADKASMGTNLDVDDDGTEEVVYEIEYVDTEDEDVNADVEASTSVDETDTEVEYVTEAEGDVNAEGVEFETVEGSIEGDIRESTGGSEANPQSKPASGADDDGRKNSRVDAASSAKVASSSKGAVSKRSNSVKQTSAKAATAAQTAAGDNQSDKSAGEGSTGEGPKRASEVKGRNEPKLKAASPPATSSSSSSSSDKSAQSAEDHSADAKSDRKVPHRTKAEEVDRKEQSADAKSAASSKAAAAPKPSSSSSGASDKKAASKVQEKEEEEVLLEEAEEVLSEAPEKPAKDSEPVSKAQQPKNTAPAVPVAPVAEQVQQQEGASDINCTANPETAIHNCAVCLPSAQGAKLECQYCNAGYYREGPTKCTLCPKGAFCGGNERVYCKEGYSTEEEGNWTERQCKVCAPGFGATNAPGEKLKCRRCPTGTFTTHRGTLPCQQCPPMTMSIDMVTSGAFGEGGTTCLACPAGLVPDSSNTNCRCPASNANCACPKGWVSISGTGNPPCVKCGARNTYAAIKKGTNIKACVACPGGSIATDGTDCVCSPGYFSKDGTAFVPGGCAPCPADSVSASSSSTKCLKCAPNTVPNAARTECLQQQQQQQQQHH